MIDRRRFTGGLLVAASLGMHGRGVRADDGAAVVCTHIRDLDAGRTLFHEGPCERRFSPCSTFKFPLALMGFDAGILHDEHHPLWDYRPEFNATMAHHRKPTDPTLWLRDSMVWYSREVTRRLGAERLQAYVDGFEYGNRDLTGDPGKQNGLTRSWIMSSLEVSTDEQVRLLSRFFERSLPVSGRAYAMTLASMPVFPADGGWTVRGKTGSGWLRTAAGEIDRSRPLGWFMGWAEKDGRHLAFTRLEVGDKALEGPGGFAARRSVLTRLAAMIKQS